MVDGQSGGNAVSCGGNGVKVAPKYSQEDARFNGQVREDVGPL